MGKVSRLHIDLNLSKAGDEDALCRVLTEHYPHLGYIWDKLKDQQYELEDLERKFKNVGDN